MHCSYFFYFRTFFLTFFFIIRLNCSLLDIAIQNPNDSVAIYNAGTDFFNKGDYEKAAYFLEKSQEIAKPEFIEPININKAHSLVKLQKYAEALDVYKYLLNKYQNKQAEHNIPILEEILRKQDQDKQDQDKQDQDKQDKQDQQDQQDQDKKSKDDSDQKQDDKNRQKQDKENSSQDQQGQKDNQKQNKKTQEKEKTQENSQHQETQSQKCNNLEDKQSSKEQQAEALESLDADEQKMLNAIDSFDKQMMKLFAATHCKGAEDDKNKETGW